MNARSKKIPFSKTAAISALLGLFSGVAFALEPPQIPAGIAGFYDGNRKSFTLLWEPVTQRVDGSALESPITYAVYRRRRLADLPERTNPYPCPLTVFADRTDGEAYFYSVRAVDAEGRESGDSLLVEAAPEANLILLAEDGRTSLRLSGGDAISLRSARNPFGVPLSIRLVNDPEDGPEVVRSVRFEVFRTDTGAAVAGPSLPVVPRWISIGYNVINGRLAKGAPRTHIASPATLSSGPDQVSLYWHNGISWLPVGAANDTDDQTIRAFEVPLGRYQIRAAAAATALHLEKSNVYPPIITPNGDGFNDGAFFILENPNAVSVQGTVWDLSGRRVASLALGSPSGAGSTTLTWNGKDDAGAAVSAGLYVYEIKGEGKSFTGSLTVAR